MKLFMMPQTVPNRPTKGAVAPMVASTPVPLFMSRPAATSRRASRVAMRSLMPALSARSEDKLQLEHGRIDQRRQDAAPPTRRGRGHRPAIARALIASSARRSRRIAAHSSMFLASHTVQVTTRGEHQADHDGLHEDVGRHEHRPRREVARQLGAADHRQRSWCGGVGPSRPGAGPAGGEGAGGCSDAVGDARRGSVGVATLPERRIGEPAAAAGWASGRPQAPGMAGGAAPDQRDAGRRQQQSNAGRRAVPGLERTRSAFRCS